MKKVFRNCVLALQLLSLGLINISCTNTPPDKNVSATTSPDEVKGYIVNDTVQSSTELFYSQFLSHARRTSTTQSHKTSRSEVCNLSFTENKQAVLCDTSNSETVVHDIAGNTYTIEDDKLVIDFDNSCCKKEKEDLPCNQFDAYVEQYKNDILVRLSNTDGNVSANDYADSDHMAKTYLEMNENELLYKTYCGGIGYEGEYYYYHSYLDSQATRIIDLAFLAIYSGSTVFDIKWDETDFFKGYSLHIVDGKSYQYNEYGVDPNSSALWSRIINIDADGQGNVNMTSMCCDPVPSTIDESQQVQKYELSKFYKNDETTFASVGREKVVECDSSEKTRDFFILYDQQGYLLWNEDETFLDFDLGDIDGFDQIMLSLKPRNLNPEFCGVYYNSFALRSLSILQCLAPTEQERTEAIDLSTVEINYQDIPDYLEYLSYLDNFTTTQTVENLSVLAGFQGLKCLGWLKKFNWHDIRSSIDFNFKLYQYYSYSAFSSDDDFAYHEDDFKYLYYLKYLVNLENIDLDYVNSHESQFSDFIASQFSNLTFQNRIFTPNPTILVETYISDLKDTWNAQYGTDITLKNNGIALTFDDIEIIPRIGEPYGFLSFYRNELRINDFDKLVEYDTNGIIPTININFTINTNTINTFDKIADLFVQNGLSYKGYSDLNDLRNKYNLSKTTLEDEINTDFMLEKSQECGQLVSQIFNEFDIDNLDKYLVKNN